MAAMHGSAEKLARSNSSVDFGASQIDDTMRLLRKPRADRLDGAIAEGRVQQVLKVPALRQNARFRLLDQSLEEALLFRRVDELQRGDVMLRLDHASARAGEGPGVKSMIPKKPAPHWLGGGNRFSERIMLH
jgi:hypothetical protein